MSDTPYLDELARALEFRWRLGIFLHQAATILIVSAAVSLAVVTVDAVSYLEIPVGRILLLVNGLAIVASLMVAALRQRAATQLLADADQIYGSKDLLSSAAEFAENRRTAERIRRGARAGQGTGKGAMPDTGRDSRPDLHAGGDEVLARRDASAPAPGGTGLSVAGNEVWARRDDTSSRPGPDADTRGWSAGATGTSISRTEQVFRDLVVKQGESLSSSIDPASVYQLSLPRRFMVVVALVAAFCIMLLLQSSGWFDRPTVDLTEQGFLLEDAGRLLAERSDSEELTQLADEIRRLGERLRDGEIEAEDARRRIDQLGEKVEEQVRNLERLGEFDTNQEMEIPPDVEDSVRSALRSGMTEGEVLDFFMSAHADGETIPDALRALDEATADRSPDTNLKLDDERIRELLDQLNLTPDEDAEGGLANDLENIRRSLQQAGAGVQELTEGDSDEFGEAGEAGQAVRRGMEESENQDPVGGEGNEGEGSAGQQGGETAVTDSMSDTFARIEDANPIFRQIEGIVGEGTIRDVIIRELPSEAISTMTESEREVAFERVIEEAIGRDNTPPELRHLVRNYFLRITLGSDQGDADEQ